MENPNFFPDRSNESTKTDESSVKSISSCVNLLIVENGDQISEETNSPYRVIHKFKKKMNKSKEEPNVNTKETGTSCDETLMHMIKANVGPGLLAVPFAFKNAGIIIGTIGLIFMAIVCTHCIHLLLKGYKHVVGKAPQEVGAKSIGYDEVVFLMVKEKFGPESKIPGNVRMVVSFFLILSQLGFCCVYFVFMSTNIGQVVNYHYPDSILANTKFIMFLTLVPIILYCMISNLQYLAPFSAFANILMIGSVFVILYDLFVDGDLKPFQELSLVAPVENWPIFFSSAVYAFEGIGCVLPVYHEMKNKSFFTPLNGVLNTSMILVAIMYYAMGLFGYLKYGDECEPSITLNLPVKMVIFQAVKIAFTVAVFITYNLQFLVGFEILWDRIYNNSKYLRSLCKSDLLENENEDRLEINEPNQNSVFYVIKKTLLSNVKTVFRTFIIFVTFCFAIVVPKLDLFISLIGAVGSCTLAIVVPALLDLLLFWPMEGYSKIVLIKNSCIIIFGTYVFIAGTYISLRDIFEYIF